MKNFILILFLIVSTSLYSAATCSTSRFSGSCGTQFIDEHDRKCSKTCAEVKEDKVLVSAVCIEAKCEDNQEPGFEEFYSAECSCDYREQD